MKVVRRDMPAITVGVTMASPWTRRKALQAGGLALLSSLAGCSLVSGNASQSVRIVEGTITNRVEQELRVDVHLLDAGNTAYWKTVRVDGYDPETDEYGGARLDDLPTTAGEYIAYARLVGVKKDDPVQYNIVADAEEHDASCALLHLSIDTVGPRDGEYPSVTFLTTNDARYWKCPDTTSE